VFWEDMVLSRDYTLAHRPVQWVLKKSQPATVSKRIGPIESDTASCLVSARSSLLLDPVAPNESITCLRDAEFWKPDCHQLALG